jgi:hypothetical protein
MQRPRPRTEAEGILPASIAELAARLNGVARRPLRAEEQSQCRGRLRVRPCASRRSVRVEDRG